MHAYTTLTQELPSLPQEKKEKLAAIEKLMDDEFNDSTMTYLLSLWMKQRTATSVGAELDSQTKS